MALSAARRRKMPNSQFALPGKGKGAGGKGPGAYPVDTIGRARNALSRVAQNGTSAEQAQVRRKVRAKYPSIGKKK
jgi:hypothetical protein